MLDHRTILPDWRCDEIADLANANANNGSGRGRMPLGQLTVREQREQASPTIVDRAGQP